MDLADLDRNLLRALAGNDQAAVVGLYTLAGDMREADGDIPAACFYLTQAFVFALEAGLPEALVLNQRLHSHGRAHLLNTQSG